MVMDGSINDRKFENYLDMSSDSDLNKKTAIRVNDATVSTNKLAITAESVSFSAGAAGTTGVVSLDKAPVYNADSGKIGCYGDSSLAWVTGTCLTTEVRFRQDLSDTAHLALLTNGQYAVDYDLGRIRYCKATTATSDTCNYNSRQMNVDITGVEDIEIGAVELKDGDSDTRADIHSANSAAFGAGVTVVPARYMATIPSLTDTYTSPLLLGSKGQLFTNIYDGTSVLTLGTGTTKTVPAELNDGTTKIIFGTGTIKNVPCGLTDGTTTITFGTGTVKTVPSAICDGTTTADVNATHAETLAIDLNSLNVASGIYGIDADAASPVLRGVQVAVDNTTISGTPNVTVIGGIYKNAFDTYDDNDAVPLHLSSSGSMHVTTITDIPTGIVGGTKTVTTAGTRVALGVSTTIKSVSIRANAANTGFIYVGGVTVDSANGIALAANDQVEFDIANLATVYIDSSVNLEGVGFTYFT